MSFAELLNQDGGVLFISFVAIIASAIVIRAISSDVADVKEAKYNSYDRGVAKAIASAADLELGEREQLTNEEWKIELKKFAVWLRNNGINIPQDVHPIVIEYLDWLDAE